MKLKLSGLPLLTVLAGPNGAGKSTFHQHFLARRGLPFVNADVIARELSPTDPGPFAAVAAELAGRERWGRLERGESFIFETVFSDPAGEKVEFLKAAQARGYVVNLVFIGLENSALSFGRVKLRVATGGHSVPEDRVHQRFPRILVNLARAVAFVDRAYLFDNSEIGSPYRFVALFIRGELARSSSSLPRWARSLPALSSS